MNRDVCEHFNPVDLPCAKCETPTLREAAQQALDAEPTQSQQLAAAGFTPRDRRLECDECGGRFTRQMLPIHKCAALAEPVQERNFCPRCGKRTRDIHTCTPPHGIGE